MRADPDFTAYVVARWTPVVRMSVLLGLPPARAEQAAAGAFARMLPDWSRLAHEGDLEVELTRALMAEWTRADVGRPAARPALVPPAPFVTHETEEQLALLEKLSESLAGLAEPTRVTLVLHHLGELDTGQLTEALGESPGDVHGRLSAGAAALDLGSLDPAFRGAASAIAVGPAPLERVVGLANAGRRRVWLATAAILAALVAVAGVAYVVGRPAATEPLTALTISPEENPVDLAWWVDGELHLVHGTAQVDGVRQLVEVGSGVVYGNAKGDVISVSDDGSRDRLGSKDPDAPLVTAESTGLVAWVDAASGDLVLRNVYTQVEAGRIQTKGDARPIAFDQGQLYFHDAGSDWAWSMEDPPSGRVSELDLTEDGTSGSPALVDAASATQLQLDDGQLAVVQPFFSVTLALPGDDGSLSPDGIFALAAATDDDQTPVVYDARSGNPEDSWFSADWTAIEASFDHDGRVIWVVDDGDGSLGMYSCTASHRFINSFDPDSEPCTAGADIGSDPPLLAGRLSG